MALCFISKLKLCETKTILLISLIMRFYRSLSLTACMVRKRFLGLPRVHNSSYLQIREMSERLSRA